MVDPHRGVGRNDPCPCGSGKKFKRCCLDLARVNTPSPASHPVVPRAEGWSGARLDFDQTEGASPDYDPFTEPDSEEWLAMDEQERIDAVVAYHRSEGIDLPKQEAHAAIHAVVESQIADHELPVRRVAQRLMTEGLDRHDAVHAIGSVLIGHMNDMVRSPHRFDAASGRDPNEVYFAELERLTADKWLRSG